MSQELEGTLTNSANLVGTFGSEGGGGTSNYNDLINKPSINSVTLQGNKTASQLGFAEVATSGNYNDLSNKPTIPAAQVNSDWNASSGVAEILNKPTLAAVATSGAYSDLTGTPTIPAAQVNSDWNASSGVAEILNKPTLAAVATSGAYSDLTGTPTIPAAQVNSDWNASSGVAEILNKPTVYANAAELPVSSSDPTDTKSYIDTGLSGKADKTSFNLHSLTGVGCNVLNGGYVEVGDFVYVSVCVKMTQNHSGDKFISGLPLSIHDGQCVFGMKTADTNNALVSARFYQGGLYVNTNMGNGIEYTFNGVLCK